MLCILRKKHNGALDCSIIFLLYLSYWFPLSVSIDFNLLHYKITYNILQQYEEFLTLTKIWTAIWKYIVVYGIINHILIYDIISWQLCSGKRRSDLKERHSWRHKRIQENIIYYISCYLFSCALRHFIHLLRRVSLLSGAQG